MYNKIVNPLSGRKVSIYGKLGQSIIRNYFNLTGGGGGILHIGTKSNKKWNCHIFTKDGQMFFKHGLKGQKTPINFVKKLRGGKSGDNVILIESEDKKYILKVFSPGNSDKVVKDTAEVENHIAFSKLFETIHPCPKIHIYGDLYGPNPFNESNGELDDDDSTMYYIMQFITPYFELHDYLHMICTGEKGESGHYYKNVNIHLLLLQLFYIISKMKLAKIHHCDMHAQNIMLIPNNSESLEELSFSHLDSVLKIDVGNTLVKVIDFGEGAEGDERCSKRRTTSSSLAGTARSCLGRIGMTNHYSSILSEQLRNASGDSDLNFFINIIKICKGAREFKADLYHIDINKLTELSNQMHYESDKEILASFLEELSKGL